MLPMGHECGEQQAVQLSQTCGWHSCWGPTGRQQHPSAVWWWGRAHLSGLRFLTAEWRPTAWAYVEFEDRALNPQSLALTGSVWEKPKDSPRF